MQSNKNHQSRKLVDFADYNEAKSMKHPVT